MKIFKNIYINSIIYSNNKINYIQLLISNNNKYFDNKHFDDKLLDNNLFISNENSNSNNILMISNIYNEIERYLIKRKKLLMILIEK